MNIVNASCIPSPSEPCVFGSASQSVPGHYILAGYDYHFYYLDKVVPNPVISRL